MDDLISRQEAVNRVLGLTIVDPAVAAYADAVRFALRDCKAVEAAPVRRGRYIPDYRYRGLVGNCSECGASIKFSDNFCPNCGARMDDDFCSYGEPKEE